jgi:hypothetical protein
MKGQKLAVCFATLISGSAALSWTSPVLADRGQYYLEQAEFEMAKSERSVSAMNRFIQQYPASDWREQAEYERDRLAYTQAAQQGTSAAVETFIKSYPDSSWLPNAHFMLKRLKQDEASRRASKGYTSSDHELSEAEPRTRSSEKPSRYAKPSGDRSQDRVSRALSIYGDRRAEKQREKEEALEAKREQEKHQRNCNRMRDGMEALNQRMRWYNLDDQGQRQYLSDQQVEQSKQRLAEKYQAECG